jgi:hypothetical protein
VRDFEAKVKLPQEDGRGRSRSRRSWPDVPLAGALRFLGENPWNFRKFSGFLGI